MRSPPVNKNELIASMASEAGLTKADAGKALDAFISSITQDPDSSLR